MYTYKCDLIRVIDGDTVDISIDLGFDIHHKVRVRLIGLDAPESRTRDLEEKKKGLETKQAVIDWFTALGDQATIKTNYDKRGKFGRVLGTFESSLAFSDAPSLNQLLLDRGLAKPYFGGKR